MIKILGQLLEWRQHRHLISSFYGSFDNVLITTVCGMFQTNSLTCRVVSTVTVRDRVGYSWNDDVPCNSVDKVQQRILHEKNSPSWNLCKSNMKTNFNFRAFFKNSSFGERVRKVYRQMPQILSKHRLNTGTIVIYPWGECHLYLDQFLLHMISQSSWIKC